MKEPFVAKDKKLYSHIYLKAKNVSIAMNLSFVAGSVIHYEDSNLNSFDCFEYYAFHGCTLANKLHNNMRTKWLDL